MASNKVIFPKVMPEICLICRRTPTYSNNFYCIFSTYLGANRLDKLITYFFETKLNEQSNWPAFICSTCYAVVIEMLKMKIAFSNSITMYTNFETNMMQNNNAINANTADRVEIPNMNMNTNNNELNIPIDTNMSLDNEEQDTDSNGELNISNNDRNHDEEEEDDDDCQIISHIILSDHTPDSISVDEDNNLPRVNANDVKNKNKNEGRKLRKHDKLKIGSTSSNNVMAQTNNENQTEPLEKILTSQMKCFTCFTCNEIFISLHHFKKHYTNHFNMVGNMMCWKCFKPLSIIYNIRAHQASRKCIFTPQLLECKDCSEICSDIETLGIHKYIEHNATLMPNCYSTVTCSYCRIRFSMKNFKNHFIICSSDKVLKSNSKQKVSNNFKCQMCGKLFLSRLGYKSHMKVHRIKPRSKKRT